MIPGTPPIIGTPLDGKLLPIHFFPYYSHIKIWDSYDILMRVVWEGYGIVRVPTIEGGSLEIPHDDSTPKFI